MSRRLWLPVVVAALLIAPAAPAQSAPALALTTAGASQPASQPDPCGRYGWGKAIPYVEVDHLPVVSGRLGNAERQFVVDTGAFGLVLQAADATALGLPAGGGSADLRLGELELRDLRYAVVPRYPAAAGGLGHAVYRDAILRLDYRARTVTLFRAEQRACLKPLLAGARAVAFRLPERGHETTFAVAFGSAAGAPTASAFFDSGAWSKISAELFDELRAAGLARAAGPAEAILSRLVIAATPEPVVLDDVAVHVARPGSREWQRKGNTALQLGSRGLGDRCRAITVDYPASLLYLDCPASGHQKRPAKR
ncbi:MAG: retropepsin-like domain-containing protein [Deltaproteobacteria bacterium]|nr:retropepsin-like domain-containing protein [Deltaproteobacteria bacterium]